MENCIKAYGQLLIEKTNVVTLQTQSIVVPNLIVTLGKSYIAGRLKQTPQAAMTCMAIGTGTVAAALADTHMGGLVGVATTEVPAAAYIGSVRPTLDVANNPSQNGAVLTYKATFAAPGGTTGGTNAITEAGIFDNTTRDAGIMMCRTVFGVVTKTPLDSITITWTITIA